MTERSRFRVPSDFPEDWAKAVTVLSSRITSWESLATAVHTLHELNRGRSAEFDKAKSHGLSGLRTAIPVDTFPSFLSDVLPCIQRWALDLPRLIPVGFLPLLSSGASSEIVISRELARSLLANSFFGNLKDFAYQVEFKHVPPPPRFDPGEWGTLDWYLIQSYDVGVGVERLKCLLFFFRSMQQAEASGKPAPSGDVRFVRVKGDFTAEIVACEKPVGEGVSIQMAEMETTSTGELAGSFVDFANQDLHIGTIIPSATQEEVLFSMRHELFIGILFCQRMADDEAIVITGAPTVGKYRGYQHAFKFDGGFADAVWNLEKHPPQAVIAIDAVMEDQFQTRFIKRDINKATLGFVCPIDVPGRVPALISTGGWGCGAFGGDHWLKFLQQVVAAGYCSKRLDYSVFGNRELAQQYTRILEAVKRTAPRVCDLYRIIVDFGPEGDHSKGGFHDFIIRKLQVKPQ